MPLTNEACKNAKPAEKPKKLSDANGLYLEIMPNGAKYWRMKYCFTSKEKRLAIEVYPEIALKKARARLRHNSDPSAAKKAAKTIKGL